MFLRIIPHVLRLRPPCIDRLNSLLQDNGILWKVRSLPRRERRCISFRRQRSRETKAIRASPSATNHHAALASVHEPDGTAVQISPSPLWPHSFHFICRASRTYKETCRMPGLYIESTGQAGPNKRYVCLSNDKRQTAERDQRRNPETHKGTRVGKFRGPGGVPTSYSSS